jgi:sortase (surface protein transpeptidase)
LRPSTVGRRPRRWATGLALIALGLVAATVALALRNPSTRPAATPHALASKVGSGPEQRQTRKSEPRTLARAQLPRPVHIAIPSIHVSARVIPLGLNPDRTLEVPTGFAKTGWFTEGPEPGERGAAVIVGHLESLNGPGVFFHLRDLRPGGRIRIRLADGTVVRYVARSSLTVPKGRFPTRRVYARTPQSKLRLITCSGLLDSTTGSHPDNYIVFASLVEPGGSSS